VRRAFGVAAFRRLWLIGAACTLAAAGLAGCGASSATPSPGPTSYYVGATPWPNGTVGQYGLRIDPTLLKRLPIAVGGIALTEDAGEEEQRMEDSGLPTRIDRLAAAMAGDLLDTDFLRLEIVHFKPDFQNGDAYSQWIDNYAAEACSQANGIGDSSQAQIGVWLVDISDCNGGVVVYSLALGDGQYLSMFENGPRDLGRILITNLY
jgi:hypothetical protein